MSKHTATKRLSIRDLQKMKGAEPIVSLTAYTAPMAALLDEQVDILLVGDSLGMTLYGYNSTLPVTMDMMIRHADAVVRHSSRSFVLVDMPFGSYQESKQQAWRNAAKIMTRTGCQAVKLEGGLELADTVAHLTKGGIPVMAHIGLKPQHMHQQGGYRYQGREPDEAEQLLTEAKALQEAGAFALLLEGIAEPVAAEITRAVAIPTIGIGASALCDGQVLVSEDMLGLFETTPRFVKQYGALRADIAGAISAYRNDVKSRAFPAPEHCIGSKKP